MKNKIIYKLLVILLTITRKLACLYGDRRCARAILADAEGDSDYWTIRKPSSRRLDDTRFVPCDNCLQ